MVMAEDGARLDRRYTYKASEDVGGFCFENGKAVRHTTDVTSSPVNDLYCTSACLSSAQPSSYLVMHKVPKGTLFIDAWSPLTDLILQHNWKPPAGVV